jgi:hypothetical protein
VLTEVKSVQRNLAALAANSNPLAYVPEAFVSETAGCVRTVRQRPPAPWYTARYPAVQAADLKRALGWNADLALRALWEYRDGFPLPGGAVDVRLEHLAKKLGLSERATSRALARLSRAGVLVNQGRRPSARDPRFRVYRRLVLGWERPGATELGAHGPAVAVPWGVAAWLRAPTTSCGAAGRPCPVRGGGGGRRVGTGGARAGAGRPRKAGATVPGNSSTGGVTNSSTGVLSDLISLSLRSGSPSENARPGAAQAGAPAGPAGESPPVRGRQTPEDVAAMRATLPPTADGRAWPLEPNHVGGLEPASPGVALGPTFYPRPPALSATATDRQLVRALSEAYAGACHARWRARPKPTWAKPGTRNWSLLLAAAKVLRARGMAPAAYCDLACGAWWHMRASTEPGAPPPPYPPLGFVFSATRTAAADPATVAERAGEMGSRLLPWGPERAALGARYREACYAMARGARWADLWPGDAFRRAVAAAQAEEQMLKAQLDRAAAGGGWPWP